MKMSKNAVLMQHPDHPTILTGSRFIVVFKSRLVIMEPIKIFDDIYDKQAEAEVVPRSS